MQLVILAFVIFRSCCHSLQHSSHLLIHFPSDAGIQSINQSFFLSWLLPQPAVQLSSISSFIHVLIAFNPSISQSLFCCCCHSLQHSSLLMIHFFINACIQSVNHPWFLSLIHLFLPSFLQSFAHPSMHAFNTCLPKRSGSGSPAKLPGSTGCNA